MLVPAGMSTAAMRGDFKRSEEHTSELQSQSNLVCRLLLEKKKLHPGLIAPKRLVALTALHSTGECLTHDLALSSKENRKTFFNAFLLPNINDDTLDGKHC